MCLERISQHNCHQAAVRTEDDHPPNDLHIVWLHTERHMFRVPMNDILAAMTLISSSDPGVEITDCRWSLRLKRFGEEKGQEQVMITEHKRLWGPSPVLLDLDAQRTGKGELDFKFMPKRGHELMPGQEMPGHWHAKHEGEEIKIDVHLRDDPDSGLKWGDVIEDLAHPSSATEMNRKVTLKRITGRAEVKVRVVHWFRNDVEQGEEDAKVDQSARARRLDQPMVYLYLNIYPPSPDMPAVEPLWFVRDNDMSHKNYHAHTRIGPAYGTNYVLVSHASRVLRQRMDQGAIEGEPQTALMVKPSGQGAEETHKRVTVQRFLCSMPRSAMWKRQGEIEVSYNDKLEIWLARHSNLRGRVHIELHDREGQRWVDYDTDFDPASGRRITLPVLEGDIEFMSLTHTWLDAETGVPFEEEPETELIIRVYPPQMIGDEPRDPEQVIELSRDPVWAVTPPGRFKWQVGPDSRRWCAFVRDFKGWSNEGFEDEEPAEKPKAKPKAQPTRNNRQAPLGNTLADAFRRRDERNNANNK